MKISIAFAMAVLIGLPAFAEIDLSGNWSTRRSTRTGRIGIQGRRRSTTSDCRSMTRLAPGP